MDTGCIKLEEFQITPEFPASSHVPGKKKKKTDREKRHIQIVNMDNINLEIDFVGYPISLINAYRRIILAEVPVMAIEKVYMYNNTSIIQDEVLAHRLGLVPLKVDPRFFEFRNAGETEWGAQDSVKYKLNVRCSKKHAAGQSGENNQDLQYVGQKLLSSSLKWEPLGNQKEIFPSENMQPLHDDILLAMMNYGHEINLEAYAVKGIGSDHAKFQPGLSWYRMLPEIELKKVVEDGKIEEVEGDLAYLLQRCFSPGVIDVVRNRQGKEVAKVVNARYDSCSRNVYQYDQLKKFVNLTRKTNHIIFHVESQSALKSYEMLEEAVSILSTKCDVLITEIEKYISAGKA